MEGHRAAEVIQRIRQLATNSAPRKARLEINLVINAIDAMASLTDRERHGHPE